MAIGIIMPRQGQSVESCIITKWHKAVGEEVAIGDVLFSYETDKASFEEEASVSGILLAQLFDEWDDVPCLVNTCVIGEEGESVEEFMPEEEAVEEVVEESPVEEVAAIKPTAVATATGENSGKVSPRAKNLAIKLGIDVNQAQATGPKGRVIERDIQLLKEQGVFATSAAMASGESVSGSGTGLGGRVTVGDLGQVAPTQAVEVVAPGAITYKDEPLPNIRKFIANAMMTSLATTSQVTLSSSFDATEILALRAKLKKSDIEVNVTLNDMILYAVAKVVKKYPALNAHFLSGDTMRYFDHVHLGLAVDTERGLMVPTIFNADTKSLVDLAVNVKSVAELSKEGTISPDLLSGASFTVTNLGTLGIESFTPVLNPPQTGILGVNTITKRITEKDGVIGTYPAMGLSLTFDHGAIDGAPAAVFLKDLSNALENFSILLMK